MHSYHSIGLKYFLLVIVFIQSVSGFTQGMEEDNTVLFMKANLLFESGRYDEAVRLYNRILSDDDNFSNAYVMRAKTKYALGAYKGTKQDAIKYIERAGVNKELIKLMSETEYKLENFVAANNYISTAIEMDPYDGDLYYLSGMIAMEDQRKNDACESFAIGSSLDHSRSSDMFNTKCYGYAIRSKSAPQQPDGEVAASVDSIPSSSEVLLGGGDISKPELPEIEVVREVPVDPTAVQEIRIDDKLSLVLTNGLGERQVESQPDILIISSEDGHVAIDLCVNSDGKVVSAEFNRGRSTINRSSMTSLAIRKTKEFIFLPSLRSEQCGTIMFKVKA